MKNIACLLLFVLGAFYSYSQEDIRCVENKQVFSESKRIELENFERQISQYANSNFRLEEQEILIPVVIHVVYNLQKEYVSEEQVLDQLKVLERDYNRTNPDTAKTPAAFKPIAGSMPVRFKLAVRDPSGASTSGITYTKTSSAGFSSNGNDVKYTSSGGIDAWDPKNYLNIWVCNISGTVLGYFYGDISTTFNQSYDGVVISYRAFGTMGSYLSPNYNLGHTASHEIGHWFGLYHLWGPPSGEGNCASDLVDDTPPQENATTGCPTAPFVDAACNNGPVGRNYSNYMDYAFDRCMNMFTKGQIERIKGVLNTMRSSLLSSPALQSNYNIDISVSIAFDTLNFCKGKELNPRIRITNRGKEKVMSYQLAVTIDGKVNQYLINRSLNSLTDTLITFTELQIPLDEVNIKAEVTLSGSASDEYLVNNEANIIAKCQHPLSISPNPVSDQFYISGNSPRLISCTLYNLQGIEVLKTKDIQQVDVSNLGAGFYLVILETVDKAVRKQLIVVH